MAKCIIKKEAKNKIALYLTMILLASVSSAFVLSNPDFIIKSIDTYGVAEQYREDIDKNAAELIGQNTLRINLTKIEDSIEKIPEIKSARVRRIFPDRIEVFVQEHQAIALINLDGIYGISEEKVLIPYDDPDDIPDLPIITGLSSIIQPQEFEKSKSVTLATIIDFIHSTIKIEPSLLDRISEIHYDYDNGINIVMIPDGLKIVVGDSDDYENKLKRLIHSLPAVYCDRDRLELVDLRFKSRVVLRYIDINKG